ncbi:hypothetical protein [Chryseobacterium sp. FH1]|uniref:hypothetical protein n=1 Tax=Chryseobacterium sp. FH1 TaxID=1233951 RepID=UPI0004E2D0C1|nr:hypothetical protein [Chryseobacterium sp. FH1]KFC19236.1 hypothetical protein IO90_07930 [Chryseobacterium sp. FH1]
MKVTIPKPCHENWSNMTPEEKGRFCQVCSKSVRDFTSASDLEIITDLSENPNICGNFRVDQLDRNLRYSFINSLFAKFAVGFVLTSGGIVSAQTQPKVNHPAKTDVPLKVKGEIVQVSPPKSQPVRIDQTKPFRLGKIAVADANQQNPNKPQFRTGAPLAINENNQPLYVVEGKMMTYKQFQQIDANNIDDIKLLKDKDATSKYGAKGKNGVVIVRLKKK